MVKDEHGTLVHTIFILEYSVNLRINNIENYITENVFNSADWT